MPLFSSDSASTGTLTNRAHHWFPMLNQPFIAALVLLLAATPWLPAIAQTPPPAPWLQTLRTLAISQLDAELRYARDSHAADGQPLPAEVQTFMHGLVPDELLVQARYTVSADAPTLPALLNRGNRELLGQDHAVSVPDLIIFSREPTFTKASDARWWAHELAHLLQYRRWGGTAGFAQRYVDDYQAVERDAEALGQQALRRYVERENTAVSEPATIPAPATGAAAR